MTTLQQQIENDFPNRKTEKIDTYGKSYHKIKFTSYHLDLSEYVFLKELTLRDLKITSIKLTQNTELTHLFLSCNELTSTDFLNTIPHPEKLEFLGVNGNNIQPTDISVFSKFVNLKSLRIGTAKMSLGLGKRNQFYGSFKSWKNLTKLETVCIETTDIDSGLEYLPISLVQSTKKEKKESVLGTGGYSRIECSPNGTNAKCKTIQDQLRPLNYDLEAWQLAHPKEVHQARLELFTGLNNKNQWLQALDKNINKAEIELLSTETNEPEKDKKIERLRQKQKNLTEVFTPSLAKPKMIGEINKSSPESLPEFKKNIMTTLQEQFEKDFNNKSVWNINANKKYLNSNFASYDLDLEKYGELEKLDFAGNQLVSINLTRCKYLKDLLLADNNLTSVDFLNQLPNPEKLESLIIYNNNIQPTDIKVFSKFVNLKVLRIGTMGDYLARGKRNQFYGSLKSYRNLSKLQWVCIEATDVDSGLEYLPSSLARETRLFKHLECSPHGTNAKVSIIQDQLRPFNYNLEAWQLTHPLEMYRTQPELFTNSDSKDQWIKALKRTIGETETELLLTKTNEADKIKRIERLKQKNENLKEVFTPSLERPKKTDGISKSLPKRIKELELKIKSEIRVYDNMTEQHSIQQGGNDGYLISLYYGNEHKETEKRQWNKIEELKRQLEELNYTASIEVSKK